MDAVANRVQSMFEVQVPVIEKLIWDKLDSRLQLIHQSQIKMLGQAMDQKIMGFLEQQLNEREQER